METDEMRQATIKIKIGGLEVDYSGSQEFIENGLLDIVKRLTETGSVAVTTPPDSGALELPNGAQVNFVSTNTVASQMSAQSGPDLIIAAVAHLQLVKGQSKATRGEISKEMKGATTFYKTTFGSNMSAYLNSLIKAKRLNQVAEQTYALSSSERQTMETLIAAA